MDTTSVTVLGSGLMGAGMARSLARAGHQVTVWNRTPETARPLADAEGIKTVDNLTDALGGADFVVAMLFDADAVELADEGKLIVLAAGEQRLRDRVAPVFDAIGSRTIWVGEQPGDGHRLRLVANSWVLSVIGATAQGIGFARRLGIDPQLFLDVISGDPLDCGYAQVKGRTAGADQRSMSALRDSFTDVRDGGHERRDTAAVVLAFTP
ncbi:MAG TPA: NAD(P)-binding domain-containing protein [Pseudonocardiaceae bacterium]|jgi:3-hydroxyisobutyrate dehydrogenase